MMALDDLPFVYLYVAVRSNTQNSLVIDDVVLLFIIFPPSISSPVLIIKQAIVPPTIGAECIILIISLVFWMNYSRF